MARERKVDLQGRQAAKTRGETVADRAEERHDIPSANAGEDPGLFRADELKFVLLASDY